VYNLPLCVLAASERLLVVVRTVADLLFNLHYGPALEQLTATQLDAEGLLAFTRESVETVSLQLGCCAKRSRAPRHDADNEDSTGALTSASRVAFALCLKHASIASLP